MEEYQLEEEGHDDPRGVVCHTDNVSLLKLQGEDEEELSYISEYGHAHYSPPEINLYHPYLMYVAVLSRIMILTRIRIRILFIESTFNEYEYE